MIKNRFVLIDTFALVFRAYYGLPPTLTYHGIPINAVYGFSTALLSAIKDLDPQYIAAGIDVAKRTKRHDEYAEYKAHRKPMPDDLRDQIPYIKELIEAFDIPLIGVQGYEGEDVIATIVNKVKSQKSLKTEKMEYIIVTGDSDTFQLIDEQTKVYSMARGTSSAVIYDIEKVKDRYGIMPAQIIDYKALKGDASDNIPGVPGIGEKTASSLISRFNSLKELYEKIAKLLNCSIVDFNNTTIQQYNNEEIKKISKELGISEKILRLLVDNKDQAFLSQSLATICQDAPLEFDLKEAVVNHYDQEKVIKILRELNFKSLIERLPEVIAKEPIHKEKTNLQQTLF